jgi:hypothetical protein
MNRLHFYENNKTDLTLFYFSMILMNFARYSILGKKINKGKRSTWVLSSPQQSRSNYKDLAHVKLEKKPIRRGPLECRHFVSGIQSI